MNGKEAGMDLEKAKELLETEFRVWCNWNEGKLEAAMEALEIYEDVEEFLAHTGWGKDNPEIQSEAYLTGNRICRWVDGKFIYFSWLLWSKNEEEEN